MCQAPFTHQEDSWYSFLLDPRAIVRLEELGQLKNPTTSFGIEPTTLQLVALCLNQLRYRMPHICGWTDQKLLSNAVSPMHYAIKMYEGSGCIDPHFLDLSTSWR
jgi:hypothetical protein